MGSFALTTTLATVVTTACCTLHLILVFATNKLKTQPTKNTKPVTMGFTRATVAGLLVGAAMASPHYGYGNGTQYTTEVVAAYTTYCPAPTTLTYQDKTYTITEATTLTVTDCPCTVTKSHTGPAPTGPAPVKPTGEAPVPVAPTGTGSTPETPAESEPAVVTAAAARSAPAGILAAIGAIALF